MVGAHQQIPPKKVGVVLGWGSFLKVWGLPFNISATAEASDIKFGT